METQSAQAALITALEQRTKQLDNDVLKLEASRDSFLRSPVLWFGVGLLTAGLTTYLVRSK